MGKLYSVQTTNCKVPSHIPDSIFRNKQLRTTSNKLLISLTVSDFFILVTSHVVTVQNLLGDGLLFGMIGCQIYGSLSTFSALVEIWTLTLVSIDRAQAIINPIDMQKRISSFQVIKLK